MRRCGKCRATGHNRRKCGKKGLRRKNPVTLNEIITISIKETPIQSETPLSSRPRCNCGDLVAALVANLKKGQKRPLQWSNKCLTCHAEDLLTRESLSDRYELRMNPKGFIPSDDEPRKGRRPPPNKTFCEVCQKPTKDGKPYCIDHLEEAPYTKELTLKLEQVEREEKAVLTRGSRAIRADSQIVSDIKRELMLKGDEMPASKISSELGVPLAIIEKYVEFLEKRGEVKTWKTSRGATIVDLA